MRWNISARKAIFFILILSVVGFVGLSIPQTRPLFKTTTPFFILTAIVVLLLYHRPWNKKFIISAISIALSGYLLELAGIHTGMIFGHYQYGSALGIKWFQAPLLIGANWFMLIYCTYVITLRFSFHNILKSLTGAGILVGYDIILEPVATALNMWSWHSGTIPLQNYFTWFIFSFIVLLIMHSAKLRAHNPTAFYILLFQGIFFLLLHFTLL